MYKVNYQYKRKESDRYNCFEELIIISEDSQSVHDYMGNKKDELNNQDYDMDYYYSKIEDKRIIEL
jgi:hypothetical protein